MIATPISARPSAVSAAALAARYDRCLAAIDDDGVATPACLRFAAWLADWWRPDGPPAPAQPPDAVSTDRRGVPVACWYATAGAVRGYVPGARGCYLVPDDQPLPAG